MRGWRKRGEKFRISRNRVARTRSPCLASYNDFHLLPRQEDTRRIQSSSGACWLPLLPLAYRLRFLATFSRTAEGRSLRKQRQGGGASDTRPPLPRSRAAGNPLSLPLSWGSIVAPPTPSPLPPSDPTALPWPARAVSRVQRTPRFALRPWRVSLLLERARAIGRVPRARSQNRRVTLSWRYASTFRTLRFDPVDVCPV